MKKTTLLDSVTTSPDGTIRLKLQKRIVDTAGVAARKPAPRPKGDGDVLPPASVDPVLQREPHMHVIYPGDDVAASLSSLNDQLADLGWPPLSDSDVAFINGKGASEAVGQARAETSEYIEALRADASRQIDDIRAAAEAEIASAKRDAAATLAAAEAEAARRLSAAERGAVMLQSQLAEAEGTIASLRAKEGSYAAVEERLAAVEAEVQRQRS